MAPPILNLHCTLLFTLSLLASTVAQSFNTYIIHMDMAAMPKAFVNHHSWYLATIPDPSRHLYTYTHAIQGFSASLTNSGLEALKKSPGYISSTRDRPLKVHTTHTYEFLGLSSSSGVWPAANLGEDVIIGLVDTGIWPESESFNDEGMTNVPSRWKGECVKDSNFSSSLCNKKLIGARSYNKGLLASDPDIKIKMNSTRDLNGHGTHTASTAAGNYVKGASYFGYANGTARGMAPRARIAMYKAVWPEGGVVESDVLAAIDQAVSDGVDILSLSLGLTDVDDEDVFLDDDTMAIASFSAMEKGIFVAAAAGNSGPAYWSVINGAPWMTTVGAGTIDREYQGTISLGDGKQISFSTLYPGNSSPIRTPLVYLGTCFDVEELKRNKKKIVVCEDISGVVDQIQLAKSAGVSGGIFITNLSRTIMSIQTSFPSAYISSEDGQIVIDYMNKSHDPIASLAFQQTVLGKKPAPQVAAYSARGPFPKCRPVLKPDLLAPGSLVLASWSPVSPVTEVQSHQLYSNYNLVDGTSMAAPHVAGVAALIKKAHPNWSPAAIRSALMTTANPLDNTRSPIVDSAYFDTPATPLEMGSGHINPTKALDPGLVYDATVEDYIRLVCGMKQPVNSIKVITRSNRKCINGSSDLNYPSFIAYFQSADSNSKEKVAHQFQRTLTNVGDENSAYTARLTGIEGFRLSVEPQKLVFKKKYEKLSYKLTVEGPKFMKEYAVHGALSWVHDGGKYTVRSPIMATTLVFFP